GQIVSSQDNITSEAGEERQVLGESAVREIRSKWSRKRSSLRQTFQSSLYLTSKSSFPRSVGQLLQRLAGLRRADLLEHLQRPRQPRVARSVYLLEQRFDPSPGFERRLLLQCLPQRRLR